MENQYLNLEQAGLNISSSMTTPTRPGKKPRPVFIVSGRVSGFEEIFRDLGGRKFRGQWSFWNDPSDELLEAIKRTGRLSYAEQVDARCERKLEKAVRYDGYSENAEARAEVRSKAAHEIGSFIPMGQPILVGHHSEKRHRRDLRRIDSNIRSSIEESKKADYFEHQSTHLEQDARRIKEDPSYIMNRIEEAEVNLRRLERDGHHYSDAEIRVKETTEKLKYWKCRQAEVEKMLNDAGLRVASPKNIKTGYFVRYGGSWYEVVRVSKKSVTIKNWLGVPTFTFRLRYADLTDYRVGQVPAQNGGAQ
jgi:hypothetical protein